MSIVLFAIIGATINAPVAYWVCFGFYCLFRVLEGGVKAYKNKED